MSVIGEKRDPRVHAHTWRTWTHQPVGAILVDMIELRGFRALVQFVSEHAGGVQLVQLHGHMLQSKRAFMNATE